MTGISMSPHPPPQMNSCISILNLNAFFLKQSVPLHGGSSETLFLSKSSGTIWETVHVKSV